MGTVPGGGLDGDLRHEQAARREIAEERGYVLGQLGPWVWTRKHVFRFEERLYHQFERYFLAEVPTWPRKRASSGGCAG